MTTFLTPQQRADRTSAAVEAAVATGRGLGLAVTEPRVLHDVGIWPLSDLSTKPPTTAGHDATARGPSTRKSSPS